MSRQAKQIARQVNQPIKIKIFLQGGTEIGALGLFTFLHLTVLFRKLANFGAYLIPLP